MAEQMYNRMVTYIKKLEDISRGREKLPDVERFTDKKGRKKSMVSSTEGWKRLSEYENTGLTPAIVECLKQAWFGKEDEEA